MATRKKPSSGLTVVDLFSGAGGLSLGAARAGFAVRGAVELDAHAMRAHCINFPQTVHLEKDVAAITGRELRAVFGLKNGGLAGLVGGPPCQGFSSIGRKERNDPRNGLFVHFFRIVGETLPKFFLVENVPGILNERYTRLREDAFSHVYNRYTVLQPMRLSACEYGSPTTRTRVFFFGFLGTEMEGISLEDFKPPSNAERIRVRDALRGLPVRVSPLWQTEEESWRSVARAGKGYYASRLQGHIPFGVGDAYALRRLRRERKASGFLGTVHSEKVFRRIAKIAPGIRDAVSKCRRLDLDGFCPTLCAGTGPDRGKYQAIRPLHPTENRVITPREAARLQGFPDWFQFSPTKWHSFRQIGNSVSPILAERIFAAIAKALGDGVTQRE